MDMTFLQVLYILRARYKIALVTLLIVLLVGLAVALLLPKQYTATASVVFDVKMPDPVAGTMLPGAAAGANLYTATQVDVITSGRVAQRTVAILGMDRNPTAQQQWRDATGGKGRADAWLGDALRRTLKVTSSRDNNIITISYTSEDPIFAEAVANAFTQAYIEANVELRADPARQLSRWFGEQSKQTRANIESAQSRLSEFLQKHGIVTKDERLDAEMRVLDEFTSQLTSVQGQTFDFQTKQKSGADTLPDVMQNSVVSGLRSDIAKQESKLQEAAGNLGKNHPQYQRMETELAALKKQMELETQRVAKGFSSSTSVGRGRESELRAAIAAQRKKLLNMKTLRDELALLQRDVDGALAAYESVNKRYGQTSLEGQLTQTNVSVLSPAELPIAPSFPILSKFMGVTVLIGILLAGGMAFLCELLDRRVRSIDDLTQMLPLPVLAVIDGPRLKEQRRLPFWRRKTTLALR